MPIITNYSSVEIGALSQFWKAAQDSNGVLYVSNHGQILTFNGEYWDKIYIKNQRTYSMASDSNGKVYVGGSNEFGYIDNAIDDSLTRKQYYSLTHLIPDSLSFGSIWRTTAIGDSIYFTSGRHLFVYSNNNVQIYTTNDWFSNVFEIQGKPIVSISNHGLYEIKSGQLFPFYPELNLKYISISIPISDSKYWLCSNTCYEFDNGSLKSLNTEIDDLLLNNRLYDAELLENGTILFGFLEGGGVAQVSLEGKLIRHFTEDNGLVNNRVLDIYEDEKGRAWISTYEGVSIIELGLPIRYLNSGIQGGIRSLIVYEEWLFAATNNGIYKFHEGQNVFIEIHSDESGCNNLRTIGDQLFVLCDNGLMKYGEQKFQKISGEYAFDIFEFSESYPGVIYTSLVEQFRVYTLINDELEPISDSYFLPESPHSILEDGNSKIWMGSTSSGIMELTSQQNNSKISVFQIQTHKLPDDTYNMDTKVALLDAEPIFMSSAGLYRKSSNSTFNRELSHISSISDTSRNYYKLAQSETGYTLIRSSSEFQLFRFNSNTSSNEFIPSVVPLIRDIQVNDIIANGNSFYIATNDEVIYFNAGSNYPIHDSFHVQVDEVLVRGDSLINGGEFEYPILDYSDNELRFNFSAANYDEPSKTQYRVKLIGQDTDWSRWNNEFIKDYTNIREGDYSFIVQAKSVYGALSESEPFTFTILPPWYRTWWAYLLYLITFNVVLYLAYKIRVNQLLKVERMRTKIASDLHDEVSATLTGITYFAEAVKTDPDENKKSHFMNLITESAGDAKEKITDIVWSITPENDNWEIFLTKCRRYASDLLESKDLKYELKIAESIPGKLNMNTRQHLWMIFKEMLTNAVRHSNATRLDIIMDTEHGKFKLIMQDNGRGFDINSSSFGNGLSNIRKRADMIKAHLELDSEPNMGTRWRLELDL